jgi:hypothetical protein
MEWIILILVLLAARGSGTAVSSSAPQSRLPAERGGTPLTDVEVLNPNLAVAGLTQVTPGVYMPDQVRDNTSKRIAKVASLGPTTGQQAATLLGMGTNPPDASFSLDNGVGGGQIYTDISSAGYYDPGGSIGNPNGEFYTHFV